MRYRLEMRLSEEDHARFERLCEVETRSRADLVRVMLKERMVAYEARVKGENVRATRATLAFLGLKQPEEWFGDAARAAGKERVHRMPVYARDPNTVSTDPTVGPLVGEAEVPERVVDTTFFDEESAVPENPRLAAARTILGMAHEKLGLK